MKSFAIILFAVTNVVMAAYPNPYFKGAEKEQLPEMGKYAVLNRAGIIEERIYFCGDTLIIEIRSKKAWDYVSAQAKKVVFEDGIIPIPQFDFDAPKPSIKLEGRLTRISCIIDLKKHPYFSFQLFGGDSEMLQSTIQFSHVCEGHVHAKRYLAYFRPDHKAKVTRASVYEGSAEFLSD